MAASTGSVVLYCEEVVDGAGSCHGAGNASGTALLGRDVSMPPSHLLPPLRSPPTSPTPFTPRCTWAPTTAATRWLAQTRSGSCCRGAQTTTWRTPWHRGRTGAKGCRAAAPGPGTDTHCRRRAGAGGAKSRCINVQMKDYYFSM